MDEKGEDAGGDVQGHGVSRMLMGLSRERPHP